jgi:hypothetical protein
MECWAFCAALLALASTAGSADCPKSSLWNAGSRRCECEEGFVAHQDFYLADSLIAPYPSGRTRYRRNEQESRMLTNMQFISSSPRSWSGLWDIMFTTYH